MTDQPDARTPGQIEADIARRRQDLALTLDEIAVRVHPRTIAGNVRARTALVVDRTAGRAYVAANRALTDARGKLISADGAPRMERIVPVAAVVAVAVIAVVGLSVRRRRS